MSVQIALNTTYLYRKPDLLKLKTQDRKSCLRDAVQINFAVGQVKFNEDTKVA